MADSVDQLPRDPSAVDGEQRLRKPYGVSFKLQDANIPASLYIQVDDQIAVAFLNQSNSTCTFRVFLRILRLDGKIQVQVEDIPSTIGANVTSTFKPAIEGFLLTASVFVVTSGTFPLPGTVYAALYFSRGTSGANFTGLMLTCGFISRYSPLAWPHGAMDYTTTGTGGMIQRTGTVPAAGAEISETITAGKMARVIGFNCTLTTSAAAATRIPRLEFQDASGNVLAAVDTLQSLILNQVRVYHFAVGATQGSQASGTHSYAALPEPCWLYGGSKIVSVTNNIQAADQWSAISYYTEEKFTAI